MSFLTLLHFLEAVDFVLVWSKQQFILCRYGVSCNMSFMYFCSLNTDLKVSGAPPNKAVAIQRTSWLDKCVFVTNSQPWKGQCEIGSWSTAIVSHSKILIDLRRTLYAHGFRNQRACATIGGDGKSQTLPAIRTQCSTALPSLEACRWLARPRLTMEGLEDLLLPS